jgi:hypothetical protein
MLPRKVRECRRREHGARDEKHKREKEEEAGRTDFWAAAVSQVRHVEPPGSI